jgi:hypothetical protein
MLQKIGVCACVFVYLCHAIHADCGQRKRNGQMLKISLNAFSSSFLIFRYHLSLNFLPD